MSFLALTESVLYCRCSLDSSLQVWKLQQVPFRACLLSPLLPGTPTCRNLEHLQIWAGLSLVDCVGLETPRGG